MFVVVGVVFVVVTHHCNVMFVVVGVVFVVVTHHCKALEGNLYLLLLLLLLLLLPTTVRLSRAIF